MQFPSYCRNRPDLSQFVQVDKETSLKQGHQNILDKIELFAAETAKHMHIQDRDIKIISKIVRKLAERTLSLSFEYQTGALSPFSPIESQIFQLMNCQPSINFTLESRDMKTEETIYQQLVDWAPSLFKSMTCFGEDHPETQQTIWKLYAR